MICLSKNKNDEYINMFAKGSKLRIEDYNFNFSNTPIMIRSMTKRKLIHECWKNKHTFYYMDYFNKDYKNQKNKATKKIYNKLHKTLSFA